MKRILHIVGKMDRGGAETMLMNLYRNIDRNIIQFDFIVFTDKKGDFDDEIISMGGQVIPILASNNIFRIFVLTKFLKNHPDYAIIHSHVLLNSVFTLLSAKLANVKHRIAHSHNTMNNKKGVFQKSYKTISIILIKKLATRKIACGYAASDFLFPSQDDVWVLPNGVEVEKLAMLERQKIFSNNGIAILQVGRLNDVKNPFFTIEIAKKIKEKNISAHIYFVGQGSLRDKLEQAIDENGLEDIVTLLGLRSDVPKLMASADIMIMPSLHEGFPVVLAEAQAIGLRSIISTGISKEVDLSLNLVSFLNIEQPEAWVHKIVNLLDNKDKFSADQRIAVLKEKGFDVVNNANLLKQMYLELK